MERQNSSRRMSRWPGPAPDPVDGVAGGGGSTCCVSRMAMGVCMGMGLEIDSEGIGTRRRRAWGKINPPAEEPCADARTNGRSLFQNGAGIFGARDIHCKPVFSQSEKPPNRRMVDRVGLEPTT